VRAESLLTKMATATLHTDHAHPTHRNNARLCISHLCDPFITRVEHFEVSHSAEPHKHHSEPHKTTRTDVMFTTRDRCIVLSKLVKQPRPRATRPRRHHTAQSIMLHLLCWQRNQKRHRECVECVRVSVTGRHRRRSSRPADDLCPSTQTTSSSVAKGANPVHKSTVPSNDADASQLPS